MVERKKYSSSKTRFTERLLQFLTPSTKSIAREYRAIEIKFRIEIKVWSRQGHRVLYMRGGFAQNQSTPHPTSDCANAGRPPRRPGSQGVDTGCSESTPTDTGRNWLGGRVACSRFFPWLCLGLTESRRRDSPGFLESRTCVPGDWLGGGVACSRFLAISPWRLQGARHVAARARCGPVASARLWLARRPRVWAGRRAWQACRGQVREGTPRSETYVASPRNWAPRSGSMWSRRLHLAISHATAWRLSKSKQALSTPPGAIARVRRANEGVEGVEKKKSTPHPKHVLRSDF